MGSGVAQLVEQVLSTTEVRGSNIVIGKNYIEQCLLTTVLKAHFIKR